MANLGSAFKPFIDAEGNIILRKRGVIRHSQNVLAVNEAFGKAKLAGKCKNETVVIPKKQFIKCLKEQAVIAGLVGKGTKGGAYDAAGRLIPVNKRTAAAKK